MNIIALRREADALARHAEAMDEILEQPGALLAAARAAGMPVIDYTIKHVMPARARARALIDRQRADAARRGVNFEPPIFAAVDDGDGRRSERRARFEEHE